MSTFDFSSKDSDVLTRTVDCKPECISKTPVNEIVSKYKLQTCIEWVTERKLQRVCLQFPDNLLGDATEISSFLKNALKQDFFVLGDTSYGSCCVDEIAAEHVLSDGIIHFGHTCLSPTSRLPVLYIFQDEMLNVQQLKEQFEETFKNNENIILFYDVSFIHLHQQFYDMLKPNFNIQIPEIDILKKDSTEPNTEIENYKMSFNRRFIKEDGVDYHAVFLGPDSLPFHNFVLSLSDFHWRHYKNNQLCSFSFNNSKFIMQRLHLVEKLKDSNIIGILIGTLGIQNYLKAVDRIKLLAKKKGKKCYILSVGKPNVAKLANFPEIDVFVLVACPENVLPREHKEYFKPIVTMFEVEMAFGGKTWSPNYNSNFSDILSQAKDDTMDNLETEPEVSLLSGRIRNCESEEAIQTNDSMEVAERLKGTITEYSGAGYLQNRTWRGLEQNLGVTAVEKAVSGRSGIPQVYGHEEETVKGKGD